MSRKNTVERRFWSEETFPRPKTQNRKDVMDSLVRIVPELETELGY